MKRLTKSTVIGSKRKQQADNKENENSLGHDNSNPTQQSQLSSYKTSRPFCGVFQASLSMPLSVLTNVCSKEVSVRNVSNRTPLSAISSTPTANQATDLRMESLSGGHSHQTVGRSLKPSLRTPNTVFTNDLTMESLTGTHTHQRVGRVLQPSLRTPNSVLTNENVANNEPHIDAEVGPSTTHAGYTECITNLIKKPSSRLMNANNRSPSDCRNLHNDFNECSEQEDTVTDAQPESNTSVIKEGGSEPQTLRSANTKLTLEKSLAKTLISLRIKSKEVQEAPFFKPSTTSKASDSICTISALSVLSQLKASRTPIASATFA
nr:uncharacterized protein LOC109173751 [Ipomoea batatas]